MMTEDILEDVLELENQKIISDELILSDTYSESEMFETADPISKHELSSLRHKVSKLIKLNKALNKFGSGFVDKETGKLNNNMEADWEHEYHYLSPEEFERAKGGVCWDYAEYQFRVLKKSGYDVINFYLEFNDPMSCNHTFTVVKFRGFYIYMESSYKKIAGIYVTKHVCDIFTYILNSIMLNYNLKNVNYVIHSYPGYDNYGCDVHTFMNHMVNEEKLIAKGYINHQLTTPGDLRRIDERFDESADDSGSGDSEDTGYRYEKLTKSSDISTFYKNFKDVFGEDASENGSDPSKYMKAIYLEDELIGYVGFSKYTIKNKKYLGLGNFMVLRKYQSNGHGSAIIKDIIGRYKTTYDQIYCYVDPKNTRALNFYKKIGKVDTSHENEEGYYYVIFYDKTAHYNEFVSDIYTEDEDGENTAVRKASLNINTNIPEKYKKHLRLSDENTGIVYYKTVPNEIPIGFVNTEEKSNGVWIQALEVFDEFRHQGYGRRLMIDAMNTYNAKYLSVRKTNKVAIDLYKSLGFVVIDETDYMYAMSTVGKKEKVFEEGYLISDEDIYYNKEKFDSGEVRLCCITGLSGSGKTTMGNSMESSAEIEHYGLDDVVFNYGFTDSNLKEYGDLIYSFFNGVGKEFRYHSSEEIDNDKRWQTDDFNKSYEYSIIRKFVEYSKKYVAVHKNKKIVLDGVWFYFCIKPSEIDDCAVYIKGTSMLISKLRAAKRDSSDGESKTERLTGFFKIFTKHWKDYICSEKQVRGYREYFLNKEKEFSESDLSSENTDILEELLLFEGAIEHSFLLKKVVENSIFTVLATSEGRRKYKRIQDEYINRNMEKLSTAGPMYLIVFGDNDQKAYFDLFGIKKEVIREAMTEITKKAGANSDFKFLRQNPILVVLYFCIRYFTIENDKQGVNATLAIFALGIYWSKFTKYFPKGVIGPVMEYTIDNMTEKFMIKKCGNIFNTLVTSINQSYQFHKKRFYEGGDDDVVAFMQRISNDQNSLLKKIANEYMKNYKEGKAVTTRNDDYDPDNPIVDDVQNASTIIQNQVSKVTLPIISNGVDLVLAEASARMAGISISDCREYLVKIMVPENLNTLESLIESILFMFIYTYGRSVRDIKSQYFLVWARALFKKTNSKDENLRNINSILEKWAEESGIYARYKREGSRINYKKGIFFYVILAIQKYS